jgi:hypothetical protein
MAGGAGDLRDQDGVEDTTGEQQVDDVGQRVGDVPGVTGQNSPYDRELQRGPHHAQSP